MNKRIRFFGMLGVLGGLSGLGCEIVGGLEHATLSTTGGGGQGTTTSMGGTTNTGGATGGTTSSGGTTTSSITSCEPGTSQSCYSGPPGTEKKGICHGGTQACKADGSGFEPCQDEQPPMAEACATLDDEDCDGHDCARWAAVYGDDSEQKPLDIKTDGQGNTYVLGAFKGAIKFGSQARISAGLFDLFLVKLDPSGNVLWDLQFGDAADQQNGHIAVSAEGVVAIAGKLTGTLDLGGSNLQGADLFVGAFSADGAHLWSKALVAGTSGPPWVASGGDGNILLWVDFFGSANFGTGPLSATPDRKAVLVTFDGANGDVVWLKQFVSTGEPDIPGSPHNHTLASSIATDTSGNISVDGVFNGKVLNLGGQDITKPVGSNAGFFFARFDKLGGHAWSVGGQVPGQLAVDELGGFSSSALDDADGFAPCVSGLITSYSNVGVKQWSQDFLCSGQGADFVAISGAEDQASNTVLAMTPGDEGVDFAGIVLPSNGGLDILLGKLDPDGNALWARRFGDAADQTKTFVATAPNGDIVLAAQVSGSFDVGTGPLTTNGQDLLVARFAP